MAPRLDAAVDAASLRVADLRRLLHAHEIAVPSGARKAELVEAFNAYVRPTLGASEENAATPSKRTPARRVGTPRRSQPTQRESLGTPLRTPHRYSGADQPVLATPEIKFADENLFQLDQRSASASMSPPAPTRTSPKQPTKVEQSTMREVSLPSDGHAPPSPEAKPDEIEATTPHRPSSSTMSQAPMLAHTPSRTSEQVQRLRARTFQKEKVPSPHEQPSGVRSGVSLREALANWRASLLRWVMWTGAALWIYYCHRTSVVGFCDGTTVGRGTLSSPACTPCPENGMCAGGALQACDSEYVAEAPVIAQVPVVSYLMPFAWHAPRCVPDTYKLILASELSDAIVEYLAHWHGQVLCGRAAPYAHAPEHRLGRYAVPAQEVRAALLDRADDVVDSATFLSVWAIAVAGLEEHAKDEFVPLSQSDRMWFASERVAAPISCRLRLYVANLVWQSRFRVAFVVILCTLAYLLVRRVRMARLRHRHVALQVQQVYEHLQLQAARHAAGEGPREVPATHLRDELLHTDPNARARRQQWARVARVVEQNANVRTRQMEWHGEWQRVWEWVGRTPSLVASPPRTPVDAGASPSVARSESRSPVSSARDAPDAVAPPPFPTD